MRLWPTASLAVLAVAVLSSCKHTDGGSEIAGADSGQSLYKTYDFTSFPHSDFAVDASPECIFPKPSNTLVLQLSPNCYPRIRSNRTFSRGKISASIQTPGAVPGACSSFYLSSGEGSSKHSEVDFEFLGNRPTEVQLNLFVDDASKGGIWKDLGFKTGDAMHTYTIEVTDDVVRWSVDGKEIYAVDKSAQPLPNKPMMIYSSFWNAGDMLPDWAGRMDWGKAPYWYMLGNVKVEKGT